MKGTLFILPVYFESDIVKSVCPVQIFILKDLIQTVGLSY